MIGQVLCVYTSYICILWGVFVSVCQLPAAVPPCVFSSPSGRPGWVFFPRERREEQTYLPPAVGLPTGASARTAGLLRLWPRQMAAVLLFYFGLVLVNAGDLPLLGAAATAHRTLRRGGGEGAAGKDDGGREKERRAGHFSPLMTMVVKSNFLEKYEHKTQKMICSSLKF